MLVLWLAATSVVVKPPQVVPFSDFVQSCTRSLDAPLTRFWGTQPDSAQYSAHQTVPCADPGLAALPRWKCAPGANWTVPFTDTHVAVRFLGGVENASVAGAADCVDGPKGDWCDLVVRLPGGALQTRRDLVDARLDPWLANGFDVVLVLDNVPWAFVANKTSAAGCQYGCQHGPPDDPAEFSRWVGELAAYVGRRHGAATAAARVQWRLGTEANGPRWSDDGRFYARYWSSYALSAAAIQKHLPGSRIGASNWVMQAKYVAPPGGGALAPNGTHKFMYDFYSAVAASGAEGAAAGDGAAVPLAWVGASHYGAPAFHNFPQLDDASGAGFAPELRAMRALAQRPNASLQIMEWAIMRNERRASKEPAALGAAWMAASAAAWMCQGADRLFHWGLGNRGLTPLVNRSGDGRRVQFFEQHYWNMALLELFLGGQASFRTFQLPPPPAAPGASLDRPTNHTVAVIESVLVGDTYYALVAALGADREHPFQTEVTLTLPAGRGAVRGGVQQSVQQYRFDGSVSVVETLLAELANQSGALSFSDGLPYDFPVMLKPAGMAFAEANIDRLWAMHRETFRPAPFEGTWEAAAGGTTFRVPVTAPSVTILATKLQ